MALTADEFEELKSLIGGGAQQEPRLPPTGAGGGRGSALTGVTNPLEFVAAQRAYESQKKLEQEKIALENGRWGAFIRFGKKMLKLTGQGANGKYTPEELAVIDLETIKKMILQQEPKAFDKKAPEKKKAAVKKAAPKKKK
jgi:hypothetical protein